MSEQRRSAAEASIDAIFEEAQHWHVNTGDETIHAKRMPGRWRNFKWAAASLWVLFFIGPYLRWGERQAVLWDIPNRQFHLLGTTILPQDFWMLSLVLLFFAILLLVVTVLVGRAWCGFFCFQTVWTDVYTLIEEKLEGPPPQRRKLEQAPWDATKLRIKATKHTLWLIVAVLTGVSFVAWFTDAYQLWRELLTLEAHTVAWITIGLFTVGTYTFAGFMREQVCLWLCPYARIQGTMLDRTTVVPAYDFNRGEPRGRMRKGEAEGARRLGDCVDCHQCVAVCPTGVDIREGQQEGCITCALCIDACDSVMDKLGRPRGLIRYESLDGLEGNPTRPMLKRPRVWAGAFILLLAIGGIVHGLGTISAVDLKVLHERQPLFVLQSDGSVQNKYTLKILNKLNQDAELRVTASGVEGLVVVGGEEPVSAPHGKVTARTVFVRLARERLNVESQPIVFRVETEAGGQVYFAERESVFIGPRP